MSQLERARERAVEEQELMSSPWQPFARFSVTAAGCPVTAGSARRDESAGPGAGAGAR